MITDSHSREAGRKSSRARSARRPSLQREVILQCVRANRTHPTAADVYRTARTKMPKMSLGTVYRNLEHLVDAGEIRKIELAGAERRYDGRTDPHIHIRCRQCGRVVDAICSGPGPVKSLERMAIETDFRITGYRFEMIGVCPDCVSS